MYLCADNQRQDTEQKKFIPKLTDYSKFDDPSKRPNPKPTCDNCGRVFSSWDDLELVPVSGEIYSNKEIFLCEDCLCE
jgi:hypothetical protein